MKTESVVIARGNVVAGVANLLDALEPADAEAIERAGLKLGAFAALLRGAKAQALPPLAPFNVARTKTPEQERPSGNAPAPAEPAPPPGEWSEPSGLLLKVLAAVERRPSASWALARHLDINKRDVDGFVLRNLNLFESMRDMRAQLELSAEGRAKLAELRGKPDGAASTAGAA